jgi:tetratricopeptide (TPR) repeat protein
MGCVAEPYLPFTPDVATFSSAFVFRGFSFGEAAYAGQDALSWQITVVGDPLYRPFGRSPEQLHKQLEQSHSKLIEWSYLRVLNQGLANGRPPIEIANLLEGVEATKQSAVLQEKLGDLYTTLGKPSSCIHAYQQALKLEPSPMQKLRLLLTLSEKLAAGNEDTQAYDAYAAILHDFQDYPDKLSVLQKILPLARKLNKTAEADQFEAEIKKLSPGVK